MIKFKNVHKHFKDLHVINGVNLEVKQGEVVVVCGPSGSGKSTLIRTVNQLESIESGEIWVDGINVADPQTDLNKVREEVGFVFQGFNLYPHLTVLENIILSPMKVKKQSREQAEEKAMELLERVGLAHKNDAGQQDGNRNVAEHGHALRAAHVNQQFGELVFHRAAAFVQFDLFSKAGGGHGGLFGGDGAVQHMDEHEAYAVVEP